MIPGASINGAKANRAPHIASLTIPSSDNERLMMELDERGIQCAVGSACSASRGQASHVLSAIGLSESDARATLRFSFGRRTTAVQLIKTAQALHDLTL
jgi:cysteine desulfurase